jgi:hypothetical protein
MAVADAEMTVARTKTTSTRIPADLVSMANVVASLQQRSAVDVIDEVLRGPLAKLYKQELAKAARAAEKEER